MNPNPLFRIAKKRTLLLVFLFLCSLTILSAQKDTGYCKTCDCDQGQGHYGKVKAGTNTWTNVNFHAEYPGNKLFGKSFEGDTFIGCSFDDVDLTYVSFKGAIFQAGGAPTTFSGAYLHGTCFINARMHGADLQYAKYKSTDFRCSNLMNTVVGPFDLDIIGDTVDRIRFNYAKINVGFQNNHINYFPLTTLSADTWAKTDFSYVNFINLNKKTFQPQGRDLSNAMITGISLNNINLSNCTLTQADLNYAKITNCNFDHAKLYGVKMRNAKVSSSHFSHSDFYNGVYHGADLTTATIKKGTTFENADLEQVVLSGAVLAKTKFLNCTLRACNMEAAQGLPLTSISNTSFAGSIFEASSLDEVDFTGCTFTNSVFSRVNLTGTTFADCIMPGVIFESNSSLQDVSFKNAKLYNAKFNSTKLSSTENGGGVSLNCAQLGGANLGGAILDSKTTLLDAVILTSDTKLCCKTSGTIDSCGLIDQLGIKYGYTTLPILNAPIRCPNADNAECKGEQWSVKNWKSENCNDGPPLWTPPKCNGGTPVTPVNGINIPDKALKQCIVDQVYGKKSTKPLTATAAANINSISCPGKRIVNMEGLGANNFPALQTLDLSDNLISNADLSKLSAQLETLDLSHNKITALTVTSNLPNLNSLNASYNQLKTATINNEVQKLDHLTLSYNELNKFNASVLTSLNYLDLSHNKLTTIGPNLEALQNAEIIFLQNNKLETIGDMSHLTNKKTYGILSTLDLQNNPDFQCSTLRLSASLLKATHCK